MISKEELEKLYIDKRMTQAEIGEIYNCDRKNIDYYLKKYGVPKRSRKESAERLKRTSLKIHDIVKMLDEGMLIQDICKRYGVSRTAIYRITKENGYNFSNNKNQTLKHSNLMKECNPFDVVEVKQKAVNNSAKARTEQYFNKYINFVEMEFRLYARKARAIAYQRYGRGAHIEEGYVIDHMYSVKDGFVNKVPLSVISHTYNLRLIPKYENLNKASKSVITLDELYKGVGVQRLSD
ncbi:helix-turn-helix domain-containing protein [Peribacillus frigoritolerans]|uniref:helix-turn-helix domain-containing protein n=1 Tax=Peribacillus frigoritolerans TaxID=450367 RepID=UPI0036256F9A